MVAGEGARTLMGYGYSWRTRGRDSWNHVGFKVATRVLVCEMVLLHTGGVSEGGGGVYVPHQVAPHRSSVSGTPWNWM